MKNDIKKIMICTGGILTSMTAGFILGCLKEKMMKEYKCIIDNIDLT